MASPCRFCGSELHSSTFCFKAPKQPINRVRRPRQQSQKEMAYQIWKEQVARPAVIKRDGNRCNCCKRPAEYNEKLDLDHDLNKGSHPELKRSIDNLQLLCRMPCHYRKTNRLPCLH